MSSLEPWQKAVARVLHGSEPIGTAWLCTNGLAITAAHVVGNCRQRHLYFKVVDLEFPDVEGPIASEVQPHPDFDLDIAVLTILRPEKISEIAPLRVAFEFSAPLREALPAWRSYGYPKGEPKGGLLLNGETAGTTSLQGRSLVQLTYIHGNAAELKKYSGAPVLVDGRAVAVIREYSETWSESILYASPLGPAADSSKVLQHLRDDAFEQERKEHLEKRLGPYLDAVQRRLNSLPYLSMRKSIPKAHSGMPPLTRVYVRQQYRSARIDRYAKNVSRNEPIGLEAALERHEHVVLQGDPGMGKSSMINNLAVTVAQAIKAGDNADFVPVRVTAREFCRLREGSLATQLHRYLVDNLREDLDDSLFESEPSPGMKWLIMVDGIDEIVDDETRLNFINYLRQVTDDASSPFRFLLATRPVQEISALPIGVVGFYILLPFGPEQAKEFSKRWFAAWNEADSDELASQFIDQIQQSGLKHLTQIPALLTMAAIVYLGDPQRHLPSHRVDLYARFVELMIDDTERHKEIRILFDERGYGEEAKRAVDRLISEQEEILAHLALHVQEAGDEQSLLDEACAFVESQEWFPSLPATIRRHRRNLAPLLNEVLRGSGILSGFEDSPSFVHNTVREFLAGQHLADRFDPTDASGWEFVRRWSDPRWREIVLFVLAIWSRDGALQDFVERYARQLMESGPRGVHFVGTALAEGVAFSAEFEDFIVEALIERTENWNLCQEAIIEAIGGGFRSPNPIDVLRLLPDNEHLHAYLLNYVRNGGIGCPMSLRALFNFARDLNEPGSLADLSRNATESWVRVGAAVALGQISGAKVAGPLLYTLAEQITDDHGSRVVQAMSDLGRTDDVAMLAKRSDVSNIVRLSAAAYAFRESGSQSDRRLIDELLSRFEDGDSLPDCLAETLAESGVIEPVLESSAIDESQRLSICQALVEGGQPDVAAPYLLNILKCTDNSLSQRLKAARLLVEAKETGEIHRYLNELFSSGDASTSDQVEAARLLGRTGSLDALRELLNDDNVPAVYRSDAAVELGSLLKSDEATLVMSRLGNQSSASDADKLSFAWALIALGESELGSDLLRQVADTSDSRARSVVEKLFELGRANDLDWIAREPKFETNNRELAVRAIRELGQGDLLHHIARDKALDGSVRLEAGEALAEIAWLSESIEAITDLAFGNGAADARLNAASWLAERGYSSDADDVRKSIALEAEEDANLRIDAAYELAGRGLAKTALDAVADVMTAPQTDADVRLKAAVSLALDEEMDGNFREANWELEFPYAALALDQILSIASDSTVDAIERKRALELLEDVEGLDAPAAVLLDVARQIADNFSDALWLADQLIERRETSFATDLLTQLIDRADHPDDRCEAALRLFDIAPSKASREVLINFALDGDLWGYRRLEVAKALSAAGFGKDSNRVLRRLVADDSAAIDYRLDAASELAQGTTASDQLDFIVSVATDLDRSLSERILAATQLNGLDRKRRCREILLEEYAKSDLDESQRLDVAAALVETGNGKAVAQTLRALLQNPEADGEERLRAAVCLLDIDQDKLVVDTVLSILTPDIEIGSRLLTSLLQRLQKTPWEKSAIGIVKTIVTNESHDAYDLFQFADDFSEHGLSDLAIIAYLHAAERTDEPIRAADGLLALQAIDQAISLLTEIAESSESFADRGIARNRLLRI